MQAALETEETVQHYIDVMLFDVDASPREASPVANHAVARTPDAEAPADEARVDTAPLDVASAAAAASPATSVMAPATETQGQPSATAPDSERGEAFLRHLRAAQARGSGRASLAGGVRKRPAALAQAPEWVESEQLRCLVFRVANLQLALPLQYLGGVAPLDINAIAPLDQAEAAASASGFADYCIGAFEGDLVIDTARLVMPERYAPAMREQYRQALRVDDMRWRFAVDSIGSEVSFNAGDVRWRSQHTRREWLAGTVIDRMCAIIDIDALHRSLLAASVLDESSE